MNRLFVKFAFNSRIGKWCSISLGEFKSPICKLSWSVGGGMLGLAEKEGVNYIYQENGENKWEKISTLNNEPGSVATAGQGEGEKSGSE
jgi:hypothetical protein